MEKPPVELVVVVRSNWLTGLRISTVAFGTTAPDGSRTVPSTDVELPADCANPHTLRTERKPMRKAARSGVMKSALIVAPRICKAKTGLAVLALRRRTNEVRGNEKKRMLSGRGA